MIKRSEENADRIYDLQTLLKQYPEGNLICAKNGNRYKWYQTDGTNPVYLPKEQKELAEQLAVKKYLSAVLCDLLAEQKAIHAYLKKYKEPEATLILQHPEYGELLKPYFKTLSQELTDWAEEDYEKNLNYPEMLVHKCNSELFVRSKSEALIAVSLYAHQIPFRYECALHLKDEFLREVVFHPDFTIRHPKTGKFYYWEHLGLMDQAAYAKHAGAKIQTYIANGMIPALNLIITSETKECPLSAYTVEQVVQQYFL